MESIKIRIGISSCLLGERVRFDGGHKQDRYIKNILTNYFEFIPICPEVGIGMGIPRPSIHLIKTDHEIKALGVKNKDLDVTRALTQYAHKQQQKVKEFSGYILKKSSPSCGLERVKVYDLNYHPVDTGQGLYTKQLTALFPELPMEEEGRLNDIPLRENFFTRVFVYHRWQQLLKHKLTLNKLIEFHTQHKYLIMAHNVEAYKRLGRMVAQTQKSQLKEQQSIYIQELMQALKRPAPIKKHVNVLMHLLGYLKRHITRDDKQELLDIIELYKQGIVPLIVPITLFKHFFRLYPSHYLENQIYMNPHPVELKLRNHTT